MGATGKRQQPPCVNDNDGIAAAAGGVGCPVTIREHLEETEEKDQVMYGFALATLRHFFMALNRMPLCLQAATVEVLAQQIEIFIAAWHDEEEGPR